MMPLTKALEDSHQSAADECVTHSHGLSLALDNIHEVVHGNGMIMLEQQLDQARPRPCLGTLP